MLSGGMVYLRFHFRAASIILVLASATALTGCIAIAPTAATEVSCQTTFVTFVGFGDGLADIQQEGRRLWEGRLADYDPSTDISGGGEICAQDSRELILHAGGKTYRAVLPNNQSRHFVLIDSRSAEPTIQNRPFLLD